MSSHRRSRVFVRGLWGPTPGPPAGGLPPRAGRSRTHRETRPAPPRGPITRASGLSRPLSVLGPLPGAGGRAARLCLLARRASSLGSPLLLGPLRLPPLPRVASLPVEVLTPATDVVLAMPLVGIVSFPHPHGYLSISGLAINAVICNCSGRGAPA